MSHRDYDVFVCWHEPSGRDLARRVAAALSRRGFRVFAPAARAGVSPGRRRALIEAIPDFVLVVTPEAVAPSRAWDETMRADLETAVRNDRNIVRLLAPGADDAAAVAAAGEGAWPAPGVARSAAVEYRPDRDRESMALLAHHLSSDGTVDERRIMRWGKRFFWAAALILLAGIALQEVPRLIERWSRPRLLSPVPPFALYWAALGRRPAPGGWTSFPVGDHTVVGPGDQVAVFFSTSADGHAYVVSRDARGGVEVLFPSGDVSGASRVKAGEPHTAPAGDARWLTIGPEAQPDTIYLIAGYDPQHNLEELVEEPQGAGTDSARNGLLESAVNGLLDGRHGAPERVVWTGKLHPIDPALRFRSIDPRVALPVGGSVVQAVLAPRAGLVSSSVELHFHYR